MREASGGIGIGWTLDEVGEILDRGILDLDEKTCFHDFLVGDSGSADGEDGFLETIGIGGTEGKEASTEPFPCLRFAPADEGRLTPSDLDAFWLMEDMMVDAMADAVFGRREAFADLLDVEDIGN